MELRGFPVSGSRNREILFLSCVGAQRGAFCLRLCFQAIFNMNCLLNQMSFMQECKLKKISTQIIMHKL
jgi:hypothetical protein